MLYLAGSYPKSPHTTRAQIGGGGGVVHQGHKLEKALSSAGGHICLESWGLQERYSIQALTVTSECVQVV
jgi:hypothetical protein